MKKSIFIILYSIVLTTFYSCEDVVDVKLDENDVNLFAVEAKITTQNEPYVLLYRSEKVNSENPYRTISGAIVTISNNSTPPQSITLEEGQAHSGYYTVPESKSFLGETGKQYTVTIEVENVTLTATDKLSKVEPIDYIQVQPSLRGDKQFLGIFTYGDEPKGIGNYYKWDIYVNDTLLHNGDNLAIASDEFVDGNYIDGLEIFTDFHNPDEDSEREIKFLDTVYVEQTSISKFAYSYFYQVYEQSTTGGLFSVPPANIESNFVSSDGRPVLGLFTAHDISRSNNVVIDQNIEDQLKSVE